MPDHFKRICSAIEALPSVEVPQQSEAGESGLSQVMESVSLPEEGNSESSYASSRDVTPYTSVSEQIGGKEPKKSRKRGPPVELQDIKD